MGQIVIRNIPDKVMDGFRRLALERGTSVEGEVRALMVDAIEQATRVRHFRAASRRQMKALRADDRLFSETADLVREDRER